MSRARRPGRPAAAILHGTDGYPGENWFPWLLTKMEQRGFAVTAPELPTFPRHSLDEWFRSFDQQCHGQRHLDVCIAHSLGTTFALRLVESGRLTIDRLISVAGCIGLTGNDRFDEINRSFLSDPFDWAALSRQISSVVVIHSENDPYVSAAQSLELAKALRARRLSLGSSGHINTAAGFTRLEVVLPFIPATTRICTP